VYKLWACHGNFIGQSTAVTQELEIEKVTCQKNKTLIKVTVLINADFTYNLCFQIHQI